MIVHKQIFGFVEKVPIVAAYNELRERFLKNTTSEYYFKYSTGQVIKDAYASEQSKDKAFGTIHNGITVTAIDPIESLFVEAKSVEDVEESGVRTSHRNGSQEKTEVRLQWQRILKRMEKFTSENKLPVFITVKIYPYHIWFYIGEGRYRCTLAHATSLLEETLKLPVSFNVGLVTAGGSGAQTSDDYAAIDSARSLLGEFVRNYAASREWLAELKDVLFRKTVK
jgi:hypothetical protein